MTQRPAEWLKTLRQLMAQQAMNPRSLSLRAGLNETAVRDMLEGRTRFPRYDTIRALAKALQTTPAYLMGDKEIKHEISKEKAEKIRMINTAPYHEKLDLLTEIIARLKECSDEEKIELPPKEFASIVSAIYQRCQEKWPKDTEATAAEVDPVVTNIWEYEKLRRRYR
jgi:transcriptional regulator with XRE-family HTH domain